MQCEKLDLSAALTPNVSFETFHVRKRVNITHSFIRTAYCDYTDVMSDNRHICQIYGDDDLLAMLASSSAR